MINEQKAASQRNRLRAFSKTEKYRILVYNKNDEDDLTYISVNSKKFYSREEMFRDVRTSLRIYIDDQTKMIRYAALTNVKKEIEEYHSIQLEAPEWDEEKVIKCQSVARRWLANHRLRRDFEGMVTRFVIKDEGHKGRCVRITVWKTLVKPRKKIRTTQKIKARNSSGVVQSEEIK